MQLRQHYYTNKVKECKILFMDFISYAPCYKDVCGGVVITPPFLNSALDLGEWSASRSCRFTSWKEGQIPFVEETGRLPDPVSALWIRENFLTFSAIPILHLKPKPFSYKRTSSSALSPALDLHRS
jgi:hypothetical protein